MGHIPLYFLLLTLGAYFILHSRTFDFVGVVAQWTCSDNREVSGSSLTVSTDDPLG